MAINSDASVKQIKGEKRPVVTEADRAFVVSNLKSVDYVCVFGEDTPYNVIRMIQPDVLVKERIGRSRMWSAKTLWRRVGG